MVGPVELVIAAFNDERKAKEALDVLKKLEKEDIIMLVNAAVMVKDEKPVVRTLEYTRHNDRLSPVIARHNGKAYAICTSYMKDAGLFDEEIYRLNLAKNIAEVKEAVKILGMFPQNLMVGDHEGNSFYLRAGKTMGRIVLLTPAGQKAME